jgi:hypothetical protein
MSARRTLTQSQFDAGLERFRRACAFNFEIAYRWPRASEEQRAQAQAEYDAAFARLQAKVSSRRNTTNSVGETPG